MLFTLQEIVSITSGVLHSIPMNDTSIERVHFDSRQIKPGSLFIALSGGQQDGHLFIENAFTKGALAALVSDPSVISRFPGMSFILVSDTEKAFQQLASRARQKLSSLVIAITGSNGKTTTKDMVSHILSSKYPTHKTYKNLNNHLGLPLTLLSEFDQTSSAHFCVLELGMNHAGEMDVLGQIARPNISIITNIGDAHIGLLGSQQNIAKAKGELLPHTDPNGFVCIHHETGFTSLFEQLYAGEIITYSMDPKSSATIIAKNISTESNGTRFDFYVKNERIIKSCFIPLWGDHNVLNCLPAIYIAWRQGFTANELYDALETLVISDMRFQPLPGIHGSLLINDAYNASPSSMIAAIDTLETILPTYEKTVVLGDMYELGEETKTMHETIGRYLENKPFSVITLGEHSRVISSLTGGIHFNETELAAAYIKTKLHPQSVFLFKASRGMNLEKLISLLQ